MKISVIFLIILLSACSSSQATKQRHDGMDIIDSTTRLNTAKRLADPNRPITADAVFSWQKFFKGPPSFKDRLEIQEAIKNSGSTSSVTELLSRGRNEFALGLVSRSEATFRQVLRRDPSNIEGLIELAGSLQRQRKIQSAFEVLASARDLLTKHESPDPSLLFRYRYALATAHLANNERDKAHPILSDLIGKDRTFLPGYAALAYSYLKDGKDSIAKFIIDQAIDRGGDHASLYNILGLLAERQGDVPSAKRQYNRALSLSDTYAPALVNRANLYMNIHAPVMAEQDYKSALEVDPTNIDALIGLAAVYRRTGRHQAAKESLSRALDLDNDNPTARFNLAILMRDNLKDEGLALRYYQEVTQSENAGPALKQMARAAIEEIRGL